ncbi:hypothetical protein IAD21_02148 [Abditibacteriota bacterium]|nr:hypothetical protein IAD21_02148 [Abditibacteriota bacterium]
MSLGKRLVQSAQKESALGRPLPLEASASEALTSGATVSARASFADADKYTKLTEKIQVSLEGANTSRGPTPQERAERFAQGATYLSESLQYVETDAGGMATVRSTPETMSGRRSAYFEAQIKNDEVTLQRFQPSERGPGRTSVPFPLSDDILSRVVEDAANVLKPRRDRS